MDDIAVGDIRLKIRNILGSFLFTNEDVDKKVGVLSGGEKARLALAKLLLEPYNVLLLDEPTNHLDMQSKDILKNALLRYNGTLILVSHDRDFLQGLSNKVIEFKNKSIKVHLGDIDDYLEKRKIESLQLLNTKNVSTASKSPTANSETKNRWEQQKQKESDLRKITKQIENIEKEIQSLETAIEEMNRKLAIPENHSNEIASRELYQEYQLLQQKMDKSIAKWEDLCKKHEQLKNQ
jgi:ATP-binding cassette subfamily F protein 3